LLLVLDQRTKTGVKIYVIYYKSCKKIKNIASDGKNKQAN